MYDAHLATADTIVAYLSMIEAQAPRATVGELSNWAEELRAWDRSHHGEAHNYATALLLKLEHLARIQQVEVIELPRR